MAIKHEGTVTLFMKFNKGTFIYSYITQFLGLLKALYKSPPSADLFIPMMPLLREDYSFTYPPLSVARYLCIQLRELRQCGMNEIAKNVYLVNFVTEEMCTNCL